MGKCMDLYSYDYNKLINKIKEFCKTDNIYKIEEILNYFGNKIGDRYVILDQELYEDENCYNNICRIIDKVFNIEDSFGRIFCSLDDDVNKYIDKIKLVSCKDIYDAKYYFDIKYD